MYSTVLYNWLHAETGPILNSRAAYTVYRAAYAGSRNLSGVEGTSNDRIGQSILRFLNCRIESACHETTRLDCLFIVSVLSADFCQIKKSPTLRVSHTFFSPKAVGDRLRQESSSKLSKFNLKWKFR